MSTWTRVADNLLRHESGRYYARYKVGGKPRLEALGTNVRETADLRLAEKMAAARKTRHATAAVANGSGRMGELMTLLEVRIAGRTDMKPNSRRRQLESVAYIRKTWPGVELLKPSEITKGAVIDWRNRALANGTGYRPPGAKAGTPTRGRSASSFNKAVGTLVALLELAVERGALAAVPLPRRGLKAKMSAHKPTLPDAATLSAIFNEVEAGSSTGHARNTGRSLEIADLLRFLAFTGCRLAEARAVCWRDVDLARGFLRVAGTKTETSHREVPLVPAARQLLEKIRARRLRVAPVSVAGVPQLDLAARVLGVGEGQKSLNRACAKLGCERLTHHDLRDAFATTAIEAGVDVPTIARWLGHADGGALLMKVYGQLRDEHSQAAALKVTFGVGGAS